MGWGVCVCSLPVPPDLGTCSHAYTFPVQELGMYVNNLFASFHGMCAGGHMGL
jgi:hypothetical protein